MLEMVQNVGHQMMVVMKTQGLDDDAFKQLVPPLLNAMIKRVMELLEIARTVENKIQEPVKLQQLKAAMADLSSTYISH